jgi:hypothetical protein
MQFINEGSLAFYLGGGKLVMQALIDAYAGRGGSPHRRLLRREGRASSHAAGNGSLPPEARGDRQTVTPAASMYDLWPRELPLPRLRRSSSATKVGYAATAMPIRLAIERRDWDSAASLEPLPATPPERSSSRSVIRDAVGCDD